MNFQTGTVSAVQGESTGYDSWKLEEGAQWQQDA